MEADGRSRLNDLIRKVTRDPGHHGLFVILRELERLSGDDFQWGESTSPDEDPVRIGQNLSLAFEGREVAAVYSGRGEQLPRVLQNVITLVGPFGPMPLHFAELVREREFSQGDPVLARFLDMILHRVFTLYYRAWALNRIDVSADRPPDQDGILRGLLSLIGVGSDAFSGTSPIDPRSIAVKAGELSRPTRGSGQLRDHLQEYFEVPVEIEEFIECSTPISKSGRWRLSRGDGSQTSLLGAGLPLGKTMVSVSNRFKIVIGPLSASDYRRFLPGEKSRERLEEWVRYYTGVMMDWDIQLHMKSEDARPMQLGRQGGLRRDCWLGNTRDESSMSGYHRHFEPLNT